MRLAINLLLSLGMLALCTWLVWPGSAERAQLALTIHQLSWAGMAPYLAVYLGLLVVVHLCRSLRWNHLLAPLGVKVPAGPLLAISSVGFMAILALPARLGEFVRPGLLRKGGYTTASAALGTVAVERIVDGLIISLLVFAAFFANRGPAAPGWMMPTAYVALGVFSSCLVFLVFAMRRPEPTVRFCLSLTLLPRMAPRVATVIERKLLEMIRGFAVLKDLRRLSAFVMWSLVYWGANGLGVWVLARAFHLELSIVGAFATMGLLGVGISLPNSPGLVGQFQWFTLLGLSVYLGFDVSDKHAPIYATALAFAIAQHLLQVAWYVAMGALGLASPWVSFHDLWTARRVAPDAEASAQLPRAPV
ncbi:MAG: flippase-like domain-containing protein [Myxococcales bacterium]|nr:flippase-like domain-containing protein [Myxococcales bacterium]